MILIPWMRKGSRSLPPRSGKRGGFNPGFCIGIASYERQPAWIISRDSWDRIFEQELRQ